MKKREIDKAVQQARTRSKKSSSCFKGANVDVNELCEMLKNSNKNQKKKKIKLNFYLIWLKMFVELMFLMLYVFVCCHAWRAKMSWNRVAIAWFNMPMSNILALAYVNVYVMTHTASYYFSISPNILQAFGRTVQPHLWLFITVSLVKASFIAYQE